MNYNQEVVVKLIDKITLVLPDTNVDNLKVLIEEVLYDYDIQVKETALVILSDIKDKVAIFLASKRIDGLSELTLYNYKLHLIRFSNVLRKNIDDIDSMDIRKFLVIYGTQRNIKKSTLSSEISVLKSFFGWLHNQEYIKKNPMATIKNTKVEKHIRKSLNAEELERLRDACKTLRERAIIEFLFATGCRLSEAVNVNIGDINWSDLSLKVIGKGSKERVVFINSKAKIYINKYLKSRTTLNDEDPLFVTQRKPIGRLGKRSIQTEIDNIAKAAGFDKSIFPHLLRHTMATLALRSGASLTTIQKLLGHTDPGTTQIYAETNDDVIREEYKKHLIQ